MGECRARAGRERRLASLRPDLLRLATHLTQDRARAEDATQETLLGVWARLVSGAEVLDLKAYSVAVLRRRCRRAARRPVDLPLDEARVATAPDAEAALALVVALEALLRLPSEQADVVRRFALAGQSYREIAVETGLPIGTVMSRAARARRRLRGELGVPAGEV